MDPVVVVTKLKKRFPGRVDPVVNELSLEVTARQLVLIKGRSGSGKSTLLHCIAGLESFDSGEVTVVGQSFSDKGIEALAKIRLEYIGVVFQFFNLIGSLTLEQNILLPAHLAGTAIRDVKRRAEELHDLIGISHVLRQYPHEVSGGEAQRAAIARALLLKPKLILADEPTGNLDEENAQVVMKMFRTLVEELGVSVLMVSHEEDFSSYSDKVYQMTPTGALRCEL